MSKRLIILRQKRFRNKPSSSKGHHKKTQQKKEKENINIF